MRPHAISGRSRLSCMAAECSYTEHQGMVFACAVTVLTNRNRHDLGKLPDAVAGFAENVNRVYNY